MQSSRTWTAEEEMILIQAVRNNPYNIRKACYDIADDLGRTKAGAYGHWYVLQRSKKPVRSTFLTVADKSYLQNRKNSYGNKKVTIVKSDIFKVLKRVLGLK